MISETSAVLGVDDLKTVPLTFLLSIALLACVLVTRFV